MRWLVLPLLASCTPAAPELPAAPRVPATWAVAPTRIRVAEGAVLVEAQVRHTHARVGETVIARDGDAYVGVTVITTDGRELDLAVQTLNQDALEQPFLFTADVDGEVQDVLIGVWDKKIEPCDVDRSGCRDFGFVLDGSLASWPPNLYTDGKRQRIPPAAVKLTIEDGGADPGATRKLTDPVVAALAAELAPFGSVATPAGPRLAAAPVAKSELRYGDPRDAVIAASVATRATLDVVADPAVDGWLLRVAGTPTRHACAAAACGSTEGDALAACLAQSCP